MTGCRTATAFALVLAASVAACAPKGDALYQRAVASLAKGEVSAAVIDLKNLVESEPQNAKARALLAEASLQAGDVQTAEIEIFKARDLGAPADLTIGTECRVLSAKGEADKVLAQCDPAKAPADAKVRVLLARGDALVVLRRPVEAKEAYQQVTALQPANLDALLGLVTVAAQTEGMPAARALLEGAGKDVQQWPRYWLALGEVSGETGEYAAAEKAFNTAVTKAQAQGASLERLQGLAGVADAQLRQSKLAEAKATGESLARAAPDNLGIKLLRGRIAAATGDFEAARTLLEDVLSKQPGNADARTVLGMVNLQQGNLGQAEMNFANVVANNPSNVRAQRLLAETRSRLQTPQQTLEALKPALEQNPDPSLLAMAGRLSVASGDRKQGVAYLSQATARQDAMPAPELQLEIASGFLAAGEVDRAIEMLRVLPRSTGTGSGYQREYLLITALLRKGDKDAAVAEAKALLERSGNDPVVRNLVAGAYAAAGQPDAGREQLQQALKLKPTDVDSMLNLARIDLSEGETAAAEAEFRKVLDVDPKNLSATMGAALAAGAGGDKAGAERWLLKATADHPDSLEATLALVRFYVGNNSFPKAKALLDAQVKAVPNNPAIINMRGMVQMGSRDGAGAIQSFTDAARLAPNEPDYTMNLARAKLVVGDAKGGLAVMDSFLASNPKSLLALQLAAAIALQGREVEKAAGYVERLERMDPGSPATDRMEGDLAMAQKRYKDALAAYRRAGTKGNDSALVIAEYSAGRMAQDPNPMKVVEDWIVLHPEDSRAVVIVAEAKRQAGNADAAIALYERSLAKVPKDPVLLNNLAVLYQEKGDPRALETGRRAYSAMPNSAPFMDTYGWILVDAGQLDEAQRLLKAAVDAVPQAGEIRYHYAAALAKAGKADDALGQVQQALKGELSPAVRTDAQKLLRQLSK